MAERKSRGRSSRKKSAGPKKKPGGVAAAYREKRANRVASVLSERRRKSKRARRRFHAAIGRANAAASALGAARQALQEKLSLARIEVYQATPKIAQLQKALAAERRRMSNRRPRRQQARKLSSPSSSTRRATARLVAEVGRLRTKLRRAQKEYRRWARAFEMRNDAVAHMSAEVQHTKRLLIDSMVERASLKNLLTKKQEECEGSHRTNTFRWRQILEQKDEILELASELQRANQTLQAYALEIAGLNEALEVSRAHLARYAFELKQISGDPTSSGG